MDNLLILILNLVYGVLFFIAFGIMILTIVLFSLAFWDKVGRPFWKRVRGGTPTQP